MHYPVQITNHVNVVADIVMNVFEFGIGTMPGNIGEVSSYEIIDSHYMVAIV
jgi:hypothetical protein